MCPKAYKLSAYFDGELPGRQLKSLNEHIQSCQACLSTLRIFEIQRKSLRSPAIASDPNNYRKFWSYAGEARLARTRRPRRVAVPLPLAIAALILISVLGALNFVSRPISASHAPETITFSFSPDELESLLGYLEERRTASERSSVYTLPMPFTPLGDPLIVRSAAIEGEP